MATKLCPQEGDSEVATVFLRSPSHTSFGVDLLRNAHVHSKRFQVYHLTLKDLLSILSWRSAEVQIISKSAMQCISCLLENREFHERQVMYQRIWSA
ncbi:rCG61837 [Rattus norvegicus]|uniref:RCG61837 n=1 Tax=Rattus norvegicus TaxID=10116 RepID=A6HBS0_RAT|nr:rCG61837 [Rattus norvegicus]